MNTTGNGMRERGGRGGIGRKGVKQEDEKREEVRGRGWGGTNRDNRKPNNEHHKRNPFNERDTFTRKKVFKTTHDPSIFKSWLLPLLRVTL